MPIKYPIWHQYVLTNGYSSGYKNLEGAMSSMAYEMIAQRQPTGILRNEQGRIVAVLTMIHEEV